MARNKPLYRMLNKLLDKRHKAKSKPQVLPEGMVACPCCKRKQADRGKRATCAHCGMSPMPSQAYPRNCCFHSNYTKRAKAK